MTFRMEVVEMPTGTLMGTIRDCEREHMRNGPKVPISAPEVIIWPRLRVMEWPMP